MMKIGIIEVVDMVEVAMVVGEVNLTADEAGVDMLASLITSMKPVAMPTTMRLPSPARAEVDLSYPITHN